MSAVAAKLERTDADVAEIKASIQASLATMESHAAPYRHWILSNVLPETVVDALMALPFDAQDVGGVSGERLLHDDTRTYFGAENIARYPVCEAVARAFHDSEVVAAFARASGASLDGTLLRLEYALDQDGFWLMPHTDLGVKKLTFLYYLAQPGQEDAGTDIYESADKWTKRAPFERNQALMFVPSDNTWHGFERRPIPGVRKSVIMNYVTDAWRDRFQLSYPETPVRAASRSRTA